LRIASTLNLDWETTMRLGKRLALPTAVAALILLPAASTLAGDWKLTPHAGLAFTDLNDGPSGTDREKHGIYGLGFGYFSDSLLGFEVDFDYSPSFFGGDDSPVPDNNLTSLMGNLVFSGRIGDNSVLYFSAGGGLLKSRVDSADDFFDVDRNDFGANAGGGFIVGLGHTVGLRGDIRYFRNLRDSQPGDEVNLDFGAFHFWKASAGLSIRL
jgi:opacity protein-like surface antigen